ncbi:hypothetical protein A2U01_0061235, partial [Trifolium medium]|nr:hypothetical protein [Trifolium medium]
MFLESPVTWKEAPESGYQAEEVLADGA